MPLKNKRERERESMKNVENQNEEGRIRATINKLGRI
jgi:hypothetical protein